MAESFRPGARVCDVAAKYGKRRGVLRDFSRSGKPTDNDFIEAFNGRFRAEHLNQHWFLTLANAAEELGAWGRYYNAVA